MVAGVYPMRTLDAVGLTFDTDWAPDFAIDWVANLLERESVPATWFITHSSPAIARLHTRPDLFELGIHPNLLPNSTHGSNPSQVFAHCLALVPQATSMRTHGLYQTSNLLFQTLRETPITTDVSLFLGHNAGLSPTEFYGAGKCLLRIPYYWEDDLEMERPSPCWSATPMLAKSAGLRIFDFHPIHVYLNSSDMRAYNALKALGQPLHTLTAPALEPYIYAGQGARTMLQSLLAADIAFMRVDQIASAYYRAQTGGNTL